MDTKVEPTRRESASATNSGGTNTGSGSRGAPPRHSLSLTKDDSKRAKGSRDEFDCEPALIEPSDCSVHEIEMQTLEGNNRINENNRGPTSTVAASIDIVFTDDMDIKDESDEERNHRTVAENQRINQQRIEGLRQFSNTKWRDLVLNPLFWGRALILFWAAILLLLSSTYCIAQRLDVELSLITECPEPKTLEDIWKHSYLQSLVDGTEVMNDESMRGWSHESCWTTRKIEIDADRLWFSNQFVPQWRGANTASIMVCCFPNR